MLSACSNGPKKLLTVSCLQFISTKELVKCIRLYNYYHWLSKGGFTRQSNAGDGYLQPANDGGNIQHQLVRSA